MKSVLVFVFAVVVAFNAVFVSGATCNVHHPVVMFPGIMGTILHGKADNLPASRLPSHCARSFEEMRVWINAGKIVDYSCFKNYFSLDFNPSSKTWSDLPGMTYTVPKWGTVYASDVLDPSAAASLVSTYYHQSIQGLKAVGYQDGFDMAVCGFDWRIVPDSKWVDSCKAVVEKLVANQGGKKAVIVGHSMGGPFSYYFLMKAGDAWVQKYVYKYVVAAPAWAGAPKALDYMINGMDQVVPIAGRYFAPMCRHLPAIWFLLPWANAFKNMNVAVTPSRNYTYSQVNQLLKDLGADYADEKMASVFKEFNYNDYKKFPGVPVLAVIATGRKTTLALTFNKPIQKGDPDGTWSDNSRIFGTGDGTVPIQSLDYATSQWIKSGYKDKVRVKYIQDMGHVELIRSDTFVKILVSEACEN